jgi:hypothetical protein
MKRHRTYVGKTKQVPVSSVMDISPFAEIITYRLRVEQIPINTQKTCYIPRGITHERRRYEVLDCLFEALGSVESKGLCEGFVLLFLEFLPDADGGGGGGGGGGCNSSSSSSRRLMVRAALVRVEVGGG